MEGESLATQRTKGGRISWKEYRRDISRKLFRPIYRHPVFLLTSNTHTRTRGINERLTNFGLGILASLGHVSDSSTTADRLTGHSCFVTPMKELIGQRVVAESWLARLPVASRFIRANKASQRNALPKTIASRRGVCPPFLTLFDEIRNRSMKEKEKKKRTQPSAAQFRLRNPSIRSIDLSIPNRFEINGKMDDRIKTRICSKDIPTISHPRDTRLYSATLCSSTTSVRNHPRGSVGFLARTVHYSGPAKK